MRTATEERVREPMAATLATADRHGDVSSRVVLLKELDQDGQLLFTTHVASRKGRDLTDNPRAALTFYWRERMQQVNVRGVVGPLPKAVSDELFAHRPRSAQATTAASRQGEILADHADLVSRSAEILARPGPIARPSSWQGYALLPREIEFWHGSPDRLHRRLRYIRIGHEWRAERLQP